MRKRRPSGSNGKYMHGIKKAGQIDSGEQSALLFYGTKPEHCAGKFSGFLFCFMCLCRAASGLAFAALASLDGADDRAHQNDDVQDDRDRQDTGQTELSRCQIGEQLTEDTGGCHGRIRSFHSGFGMGGF